jgi:glucose-1-phosphate thymidylyltransferase
MVEIGNDGFVSRMIETPNSFDGNTALAEAYYIKKGSHLRSALAELIRKDNNGLEYQLTDALKILVKRGFKVGTFSVGEGYDCGRPESLLISNYRMLSGRHHIDKTAMITNSDILEPCFIGENAIITSSEIGPYASIGKNVKITDSIISQSIIEQDSIIKNKDISYAIYSGDVLLERLELAR